MLIILITSKATIVIMNGRIIKINRIPAAIAVTIVMCIIVYFYNTMEAYPHMYGMFSHTNKINMRKLLIASVQAAQQGGLEVIKVANGRNLKYHSKGKTDEGVNDPYTAADGQSHCVIKHGLLRIFPKLKIQSEEDDVNCVESNKFELDPTVLHESTEIRDELIDAKDVVIWIDPLDATKEFTEALYQYVTTMVCVAVKGKPVIGVIHNPFNGQTAWAWVQHSASEYLTNIRVHSTMNIIQDPIITVSRSHAGDVKGLIRLVFGKDSKILAAAGSGYKVLQVIANNATVYLHSTKIKKWDICAGDAILTAMGGTMTNLVNEHINYALDESPVNTKGLLATLTNHEYYMQKLIPYYKSQQQIWHQQKNSPAR